MKWYLAFFLCLVIPVSTFADFDLREELDAATFRQSGLEKLTDEEMATLNGAMAKLLGKQEEILNAEAEIPRGEDRFGLESVKTRVASLFRNNSPNLIESRILGDFTGWQGKTLFRLENGQVWQQTVPDTFIVRVKDPKVTIRRGMFSSYLLKIEGYNSSVKVERIE